MRRKDNERPNLSGVAALAFILGALLLGLSFHAKLRGEEAGTDSVLLGVALLIGSAAAYGLHKNLAAMTPEERDRYWSRKDAEDRAAADSYARHMLGKDYDKK
jgi:hypothetical protein